MRVNGITTALLAASLLSACGGGSSSGDGGSPSGAGGDERVSVDNGFVNVSHDRFNANGALLLRATQRVDTATNRITEEGENFATGETFTATLDYDEFGNQTRTAIRSVVDQDVRTIVFVSENDARGLLRSSVRTESVEFSDDFVETERFRYDARDRLVERETREGLEETGEFFENSVYEYGADGLPVSSLNTFVGFGGDDDVIERERYTHDADGRLAGIAFDVDDDGSTDGTFTYEYDASGNMVRQVRMDGTGAVTSINEYGYEAVDEPVYNRWLRAFRYFL